MHSWTTIGFILLCSICSGQTKPYTFDPVKPLTQSAIDQWTSDNGLFTNNLTSVLQAKSGFLWITTYNGLIRFDGHRFELLDRDYIPFLKTDAFYRVYEDKNGTLWFATQGSGIVRYANNTFSPFLMGNNELPKSIRCLLFSQNGDIWAGANNSGLYMIRDSTVTAPSFEAVRDISILTLAQDAQQAIWVGTNGNGAIKIDKGETTHYTVEDGLPSNVVNTIRSTSENEVIIGTAKGVSIIDKQGVVTPLDFLKGVGIITLMVDDFGSIWLATENGLARINRSQNVYEVISPKQGLPTLEITSLSFDREGSLWMSSSKGGLIRLKDTGINTYNRIHGLSSDLINIINEGADRKIYIGSDGGDIDILTKDGVEQLKLPSYLGNASIRDIAIDKDGSLWIGNYNGVLKKNGAKEVFYNIQNGLPAQDVRRIYIDKLNQVWIATRSGGAIKFKDGKVLNAFNRKNGLSSNYVLSLEEDVRGNIYIGTNGGGLSRVNVDESTQTFHFTADDSGILIFNIHIDESGALWVVTNDGLYYFNGSEFKKLILDHPTKGETYFDWVEDDAGNVWVTTNRGILSFRKEDVKNFIRTNVPQIKTRLYNNRDGMKNKECTAATRSFKSSKGEIWVPTNGGASVVTPKQLKENMIPPKVYITQVVTDDHEFQTYAPIIVEPGNLRYTFKFTSLSMLAPDKNKFKYKLEPLEEEWTTSENEREVQYTNLEPGRYTFSVMGTNNDGIWSTDIASVSFRVKPFFYQTTAFYILSGVVTVALLLGLYKWRVHDIEKRNRELKKVNSELDKFVYSASHDLRAPLSSVLGLVNVARMDKDHANNGGYLNMIEKSITKLDGFIRDIIDFSRNARMDVASDEVAFEKLIREVMEDLKYLDESNRILRLVSVTGQGVFYSDPKRLKVIISNLISNAIKYHNPYAENPIIEVKVDYNEKTAVIQVIDNGSGIAEEHLENIFKMFYRATDNSKGSGLGLYIVKETIERMSGEIKVKSEVGKGTIFEITLNNLYAKEFKILKAKTA